MLSVGDVADITSGEHDLLSRLYKLPVSAPASLWSAKTIKRRARQTLSGKPDRQGR